MKRWIIFLILLGILASPVIFFFAAMEAGPSVARKLDSTPADAKRTREILHEFKALTEVDGPRHIVLSERDMNGGLAFGTRAFGFLRGRARIRPEAVQIAVSADARRIPAGGWLNIRVAVRPSETGFELARVEVGPFALPETLVLPAIALALDLVLGDGLGQIAVKSIDGVAIAGDSATFGVGLSGADRKVLARRAKETARAGAGINRTEDVKRYFQSLDRAVKDGRLSPSGSTLPFIRFALREAHSVTGAGSDRQEIEAAILALATYCGHLRFQNLVGEVLPVELWRTPTGCAKTTLAGRGDLRQHFLISAGLEVAGDAGFAFAIGEFKELLDSNTGGSGFSFDDLAADRAGIRFAETILAADPQERARLIDGMTSEEVILPSIEGLPSGLSEAQFSQRFKNADSAEYRAVVEEIDRRIARLPLYKGR